MSANLPSEHYLHGIELDSLTRDLDVTSLSR